MLRTCFSHPRLKGPPHPHPFPPPSGPAGTPSAAPDTRPRTRPPRTLSTLIHVLLHLLWTLYVYAASLVKCLLLGAGAPDSRTPVCPGARPYRYSGRRSVARTPPIPMADIKVRAPPRWGLHNSCDAD